MKGRSGLHQLPIPTPGRACGSLQGRGVSYDSQAPSLERIEIFARSLLSFGASKDRDIRAAFSVEIFNNIRAVICVENIQPPPSSPIARPHYETVRGNSARYHEAPGACAVSCMQSRAKASNFAAEPDDMGRASQVRHDSTEFHRVPWRPTAFTTGTCPRPPGHTPRAPNRLVGVVMQVGAVAVPWVSTA